MTTGQRLSRSQRSRITGGLPLPLAIVTALLVLAAALVVVLRFTGTSVVGGARSAPVAAASVAHDEARPLRPATRAPVVETGWSFDCKGSFTHVEKGPNSGPLSGERVLLIGDSLTANSAAAHEAILDQTGASYVLDAMPGSSPIDGASAGDCMLWEKELPTIVAQFRPTIVVAEFCCNYWYDMPDATGTPVRAGTDAFVASWEQAVRTLAADAQATAGTVYWVVTPPSSKPSIREIVDQANEAVLRAVAAGALIASHLIRWDLALTGGTGLFTPTLDGHQVRQGDGVHIASPYGSQLVAQSTLHALLLRP